MRLRPLQIPLLLVFLWLASTSPAPSIVHGAATCCDYALIFGDIKPSPGERFDITGIVTDQYGAGLAGVLAGYHDVRTDQNTTTNLQGIFRFGVDIPVDAVSGPSNFQITLDALAATDWSVTVSGSYSVETGPSSTNVPVLYHSEGPGGVLGSYIRLSTAPLPLIIYIGGGYELDRLHGVNQLDQATSAFLEYLAASGFHVIAPIGWYVNNVPSLPLVIGALMRYGFLMNKVFVMGWSAGGVVTAWALTHDFNHIINSGVVMDAELTGPQEPATHTDHSVFTTAQLAGQVSVPHLLVWGKGDSGAIGIQSVGEWFKNAGRQLVRVDLLEYTHDWLGTSVESLVRADVTSFLKNGTIGMVRPVSIATGGTTLVAYLTSKGRLSNASYAEGPGVMQMSVEDAQSPGIINLVIPRSAFRGAPVLLLDGDIQDVGYYQDDSSYYLFYSYPQGNHVISIGGQDAIPEFATPFALIVPMIAIAVLATRMRRVPRLTAVP